MAVVTRQAQRGGATAFGHFVLTLVIVPLSALFVALAFVFAAEWLYADRVLPSVTVAGVDVGSLGRADALARLEGTLSRPWAESAVVAAYDGRAWRTTNGSLGVRPDVAAATGAALAYGKSGTTVDRLLAWAGALRGDADVPLAMRADGDALERWVAAIATEIDRPAVSGSLVVGVKGLIVTEPVVGAQLERAATAAALLEASSFGDREIALSVRRTYPAVDESGFRDALARAQAIVTPLTVTAEDRRVDEDPIGLATLLTVDRVLAKPGELAPIPAGAVAPAQRYRYTVALNEARMAEWASALAARLDRPGVNARYTVGAEGALAVKPGVAGIRVDQEQLKALLQEQLPTAASGTRVIAAPISTDTTTFTTEQAKEWLPKLTKASTFSTQFPVSASRHANIATGSAQFDGVVVMPGQTFSFWELLGPVTVERGYAYAGAIIENRSDENVIGGGLCQVSTTIFNAVASLGYEIVERHEHGYLIERYPIGLDAAVFEPGLDLRWRNDTGSPVFLWSWVGDTFVTFDVWGLPTGRTVTFSAPSQWNFVAVPKTQPADPAFPKGYAISGRDVARTRTVTQNGAVLYTDTFYSHYAPVWGGPAEEPKPAPAR